MAKKIPSDINSKKQFQSEEEALRVLKAEAFKLIHIARKVWRLYESSYSPKRYAEHITGQTGRTGRSYDSIKLGEVKKINADEYGIEVTFLNKLAYHESAIGKSQPKGHAIMLISSGWKVKKGKHKKIYRFGYFEGFDYLGKVKKEYNDVRDERVSLEIQWLGSDNYTK